MSEHEMVLLRQFTETGDAEAFSEITRRYAGLVYGTCLRVTGDAECARDATQDTFFQLLKQARRVTGSLGGWLHQVATRRAVDLVRRDKARRERERAFTAQPAQETDSWGEVSPLVDEAMNEIEPGQRDLLLRHFLQGESTVQLAAAEGVSQPTMSRRVEAALEQLRERLRKKGVVVAAAALGTIMVGTAQEAPAAVLAELGKMALAGSGSAAAGAGAGVAVSALKMTLAIGLVVGVVGTGSWAVWRAIDRSQNALPPPSPRSAAMMGGAMGAGPAAFAGQPMGFGGMMMGGVGPVSTATPESVLTSFTALLLGGDPLRTTDCFAGTTEAESFQRLWTNPQNEKERNLQIALRSLIPPVEVLKTNSTVAGLEFRWTARVRQPFTLVENGVTTTWQPGDRFELAAVLKQFGDEWKIVGF